MTISHSLHPLLAGMEPSQEQIGPIMARQGDIAVTAGAGAGKTRTLVVRYLSLLVEGLPLRSIVAITFTKKAAREMRNRVREAMRAYLQTEGLPDDERATWRDTYARLDAARIGTIHSLCAEILRHHPAEMELDPRFEMLEEGQMALLQAQVVDTALGWAAEHPETASLFSTFSERGLRRILARLLERRLDVSEARETIGEDLWSVWKTHLVQPIAAFVDEPTVRADFEDLEALQADGTLERAAAAGDSLAPELRAALHHWRAIRAARRAEDWYEVSRHLAPLRDALKQKGRKANWAPARPKTIIARLQDQYDESVKSLVKKGIDLGLDRHLAQEIVPALLRLHDHALDRYHRAKRREHGQPSTPSAPLRALDFDDLEAAALRLLRRDAAARAHWQGQIQALLIDEFQDTNARQRDLLAILNGDAGKLFIVGDGKQSIYRFRGADVTVFREEREAIAENGAGYQLATSYRAHRRLIEILNAALQPVLGERDPERPYVEPFAALEHHREDPAPGLTPPYLELHLAVGTKSDGALDRAAQILATRLAALVEGGDVTLAREEAYDAQRQTRPLDYGDVAILCRASSSFAAYENALEATGIPFLTVAGRGFYDRPEVRDVLNALQALADPSDDLALAGLLRSVAVGLSDMGLYRLRQAQRSAEAPSLWHFLQGCESSPSIDLAFLGDEASLADDARRRIQHLHDLVGRTTVADVLKAFLDATAYRATLLRAGQARGANNLDKLLADAHASGIVGVGEFVEYVTELRDVAAREGEARAVARGAVQIMTVHQAKGLEFPVVVIGDAARRAPRSRGVLIDETLGLVPPLTDERLVSAADGSRRVEKVTSAAYRLAQERESDRERAESDRLLYVAATRARDMLLISGTLRAYKSGAIGTYGWLDRLDTALQLSEHAPPCDDAGDVVHRFSFDLAHQPVCAAIYEPEARLPTATVERQAHHPLALPDDLELLQPLAAQRLTDDEAVREAERDPPRRVWRLIPQTRKARAPSWVVGQLVHVALAHWLFPDDQGVDFYVWAANEARSCGVTDEQEVKDGVQRAARLMNRFQVTALHARMAAARRLLHEVPYSVADADGAAESGVIDALFEDDHGWTLVEFKTDYAEDRSDMERIAAEEGYVEQVKRYLAAIERLLGERPHPKLCFLNVAGQVQEIQRFDRP